MDKQDSTVAAVRAQLRPARMLAVNQTASTSVTRKMEKLASNAVYIRYPAVITTFPRSRAAAIRIGLGGFTGRTSPKIGVFIGSMVTVDLLRFLRGDSAVETLALRTPAPLTWSD